MEGIIDFDEVLMLKKYPFILDILLADKSSKKNIKWCTDNYQKYGINADDSMNSEQLIRRKKSLIKPRILKSETEQRRRIRDKAEVFTPSWICNKQNNLIDSQWFGVVDSFNIESGETWLQTDRVIFPKGKTWIDYVELERIEITCGEAPYLTSRYDTTSGNYISVEKRIGLYDRKLRVISENVNDKEEWLKWALIATQRIYGYEWQGDSLLIARENILLTFLDFYIDKFHEDPSDEILKQIAEIISWNIWQMDGIKCVIPNSCHEEEMVQLSLFEDMQEEPDFCCGCRTGNNALHNGIYCKIKDWKNNKTIRYFDLLKGGHIYVK